MIDGSLCCGELRVPVAFALGQPGDLVGTVSLFGSKDNHADGLLLIMASLPGVSLEAPWIKRHVVVVLVDHVPVEGEFSDGVLFEPSFVDLAVPSVLDFFRGQKGSCVVVFVVVESEVGVLCLCIRMAIRRRGRRGITRKSNTASPSQSGCSDYGWLCCNCSTHLSIVSCCCCCSCCC